MWNIVGLNKSRYMLVEFSESADVAYRKLQQILAETEIRLLGCILNGTAAVLVVMVAPMATVTDIAVTKNIIDTISITENTDTAVKRITEVIVKQRKM